MDTVRRGAAGVGPVPPGLRELSARVTATLGDHPAASLVERCLTNSWTTAMCPAAPDPAAGTGRVFVLTGDIPAMWLRDSAAQVRPYLAAATDPVVYDVLAGVVAEQVRCVLLDPYANAFNDGATGRHGEPDDLPAPGPGVWERKYEVDSLAAPLQLAYALWRASGRTDHLTDRFRAAGAAIVSVWTREQDHQRSDYRFVRPRGPFRGDTLPADGHGSTTAVTGMTWSGFRPSDDRCEYGYLVPANAAASVALHGLAELTGGPLDDQSLASDARRLAREIDTGITEAAVVEHRGRPVLAYEVDGLGSALLADDANQPNLLGLPLLGWCRADDPLYRATREFVLSADNPWYVSGRAAKGLGSPHTPAGHVWPIAIATAGLTGTPAEANDALEVLAATTAGTGFMHESFHVGDPAVFTRPWFGWANAMFAELALSLAGVDVASYYPAHPRASRTSVR